MDPLLVPLIEGQQMFGFLEAVLWTLLRVAAMVLAAPLIGTRTVPRRVRAIFAIALAAVMAPLLPPPPVAGVDALTALNVLREMAIGVALGFTVRLCFEGAALAGELVAQGMALAFAQMADPLKGAATSGVVGMWFYIAFALLFLAFDGHLGLIRLVFESYTFLPIGMQLADPEHMAGAAPRFLAVVFLAGAQIALPIMIAMLVVNLSFGVLSRAAPALNPIAVGLPAALLTGLVLLGILVGELAEPARLLFEKGFEAAYSILR
jgi:flagellar biosynthesis protein FliR